MLEWSGREPSEVHVRKKKMKKKIHKHSVSLKGDGGVGCTTLTHLSKLFKKKKKKNP